MDAATRGYSSNQACAFESNFLRTFLWRCKYGIIDVNNEKMSMCAPSPADSWFEVDEQQCSRRQPNKLTVKRSNCRKWLRRLRAAGVSVTVGDVSRPCLFFSCNVINFYTAQALACFSSSCCSPRAKPATDTVPGETKSITYSFRRRRYSRQDEQQQQQKRFFANKRSSHLSIQKHVCSFTVTSGSCGIIIYYRHPLPHH